MLVMVVFEFQHALKVQNDALRQHIGSINREAILKVSQVDPGRDQGKKFTQAVGFAREILNGGETIVFTRTGRDCIILNAARHMDSLSREGGRLDCTNAMIRTFMNLKVDGQSFEENYAGSPVYASAGLVHDELAVMTMIPQGLADADVLELEAIVIAPLVLLWLLLYFSFRSNLKQHKENADLTAVFIEHQRNMTQIRLS